MAYPYAHLGQVNWFSEYLSALEDGHGFESEALRRILNPIQLAIRQASERIDHFGEPQSEEQEHVLGAIVHDDCAYIEDLLGPAFVACQTYITRVVSRTKELYRLTQREGKPLPGGDPSKKALLQAGSPRLAGTAVTKVQVIDAFANYFKHHEEWPAVDWKDLPDREKATADVIHAAGAQENSTGVFRSGARVLDNPALDNLEAFAEAVVAWRGNVAQDCTQK